MADIIEDLLVAARARMGSITIKLRPVDLAGAITSATRASTHHFDLDSTPESVMAHADPTRVSQILRNLVVNSVRHGAAPRRILLAAAADTVMVEVRDAGGGIPPEMASTVFDPYVSGADGAGLAPSMGLGLWLSRSLAELMDGSLTYQRDGDETVFRLTLPSA